eukprot:m.480911 g.480911  ORF g.480911 m.480911 type:complete len:73 (-) comp54590_c0_seq1:243-461(-)
MQLCDSFACFFVSLFALVSLLILCLFKMEISVLWCRGCHPHYLTGLSSVSPPPALHLLDCGSTQPCTQQSNE